VVAAPREDASRRLQQFVSGALLAFLAGEDLGAHSWLDSVRYPNYGHYPNS
jgi:hypothetical protein